MVYKIHIGIFVEQTTSCSSFFSHLEERAYEAYEKVKTYSKRYDLEITTMSGVQNGCSMAFQGAMEIADCFFKGVQQATDEDVRRGGDQLLAEGNFGLLVAKVPCQLFSVGALSNKIATAIRERDFDALCDYLLSFLGSECYSLLSLAASITCAIRKLKWISPKQANWVHVLPFVGIALDSTLFAKSIINTVQIYMVKKRFEEKAVDLDEAKHFIEEMSDYQINKYFGLERSWLMEQIGRIEITAQMALKEGNQNTNERTLEALKGRIKVQSRLQMSDVALKAIVLASSILYVTPAAIACPFIDLGLGLLYIGQAGANYYSVRQFKKNLEAIGAVSESELLNGF